MKKTINVTIEEEDWDWLRSNQINISAFVRALIVKKRNEVIVNVIKTEEPKPTNTMKPLHLDKEIEDILCVG
jgi:hypothetical protein